MLCLSFRTTCQTSLWTAILLGACAFVPSAALAVDHLKQLNCTTDQIAKFNGNDWVCSADEIADVSALEAQVAALEASLATALASIAALQAADTALDGRITAIENNTVLNLDGALDLDTTNPSRPIARFEAVNVQIVDGAGQTISPTPNGLGNLIIGYDEPTADVSFFLHCSVGPHLNQTDCEAAGATWAANQKTGNHNLVVGTQHNYSQSAGVVFGLRNTVNRASSTVTGGQNGVAAGEQSSITGGNENSVGLRFSTISGGFENTIPFTASNGASVISGGSFNTNNAGEAIIGGGSGCVLASDDDLGWGAREKDGTNIGDCAP